MERRPSTAIRLSTDVVDQNGVARFADDWGMPPTDDAVIAPWIEYPPTPPPKSTSTRSFGFAQKTSLASMVSLRQNSTSSIRNCGSSSSGSNRPSESRVSLHVPDGKRRSADDNESSRGLLYSGSSTHSSELRKQKSSLFSFSRLKTRASKTHLRADSDDSEHPSLRPPVPPLPEPVYNNALFNGVSSPSLSTPSITLKKEKKDKGKKKASQPTLTPSPPKSNGQDFSMDLNLDSMDGIVDFSIASSGPSPSNVSNGVKDSGSPSSGSHSDYSSYNLHFLPPSEFSDPFSPTSVQDKRKAIIPQGDYRKVSPKTMVPPHRANGAPFGDSAVISSSTGPGSPTWVPPESWAVEKGAEDPYNNPELSEPHESGSEAEGAKRRMVEDRGVRNGRRVRHPNSASFSSVASATSRASRTTIRQNPTGPTFKMKIFRQNSTYNVIAIDPESTVANMMARLNKKFMLEDDNAQYNLYLKEQGRERILGQSERPADIIKLRMKQAGYDADDGAHLLGIESLSILLKFVYKSQLLAGDDISLEIYDRVDLSGQGLRTIPVALHQNADSIIWLRLSRNPMIELPLDFIQSCTTLRELHLTHMSMKKVPQSIRHSTTLLRLYLSSNCIRDLDDACLDRLTGLHGLYLQNNALEKLPWHFPRLRHLLDLDISNNKFKTFPIVVTQLESLRDLNISFNMITELPEQIGKMKMLQTFLIVGNQFTKFPDEAAGMTNLCLLDCRRNAITDLSVICMLPKIHTLKADYNATHGLDLSLGPQLATLIASHNDITQLLLAPGPMGKPPYNLTLLDVSYAKLSSLDDFALRELSALRTLRLDHNSIRSIPDSLGDLKWLETLSCTDNKLDALPSTIGKLQKLEILDAHNNSLTELPQGIWNCASLRKINVTSNSLGTWHDPPVIVGQESPSSPPPSIRSSSSSSLTLLDGSLGAPESITRKPSVSSISSTRNVPPLVHALEKLYLGENCLTDNVIYPLMIFKELRVLNLSFNEIQDLPPNFFHHMHHLEELYLSGNKLTSIPAEDFPRLIKLHTLFLNGNKLHTLPQELGKVANLTVLDVGSNYLKYNINNWEFDWNWNFNTNLKYLNLSGNKRLQIKAESTPIRAGRHLEHQTASTLSGFTNLSQLKVLGLMDVTITTIGKDATVDIPDENPDRRIRTSLSAVCNMGYGIADSMGKNESLYMLDLVHEFQGRKDEVIFAMFGRSHPPSGIKPGVNPNRLSKFLHDNFAAVFKTQLAEVLKIQLAAVNDKPDREVDPQHLRKEAITKALRWTFLKINQDLRENLTFSKGSQVSMTMANNQMEVLHWRMGVSGVALYFLDKTIYAANVGDCLAVVSRQGVCQEISRKHDPYDRLETARIRAAEGSITSSGLVNEEVEVSRSFGYFHHFPPINARPDIFVYDLTEMDEFVIIANRGLWDFVPYQTAVDIARTVARTERPDPMLAAQKLRDFAISYGADGSVMIMVIWVADLFNSPSRARQPTLDSIVDPQMYRSRKKDEVRDRLINRLDGEVPAPTGHVTLVFTDIRNSTHLWEANPGMPTAMRAHNSLLRRQLRFCGGYEVKTEGDAFMCSFPTSLAAVWWCLTVQVQLLHESWPLEILECEDGKPIYDDSGNLIARGLSVRMGIHNGTPLCETDPITHRMDYFGPMVNRSARIQSSALGGQIMCSMEIIREINARVLEVDEETEYSKQQSTQAVEAIRRLGLVIVPVGEVKLKGIELPEILSILYPSGLEGRHELKEAPSGPTASGSRVQFSVPQIQELGLLCLRIEALSTGRVFKPIPQRKASIVSNLESEDNPAESRTFYGDPNLLLPPINDNSSDANLMLVLDSLSLRIDNAVNAIYQRYQVPPPQPTINVVDSLMSTLIQDGALNSETLEYIASMLQRQC